MENTILEYKCPNCGGKLEFDSTTQKMTCPFCDSEIDVQALLEFDSKLSEEQKQQDAEFDITNESLDDPNLCVYTCNSCGGEIIADKNAAAMHCPFCDNPVIFTKNLSGDLKPDYVIPFQLSKEDAKKQLLGHLKGKPFLPKVFKTEHHIDEIKAIYVPFWLYTADVRGDITFKGTKVRTWSDSKYMYTETSFYEIFRDTSMSFDKVPADGSSKMPDDLMESLEPFDFSKAVDFQTAYLSGFLADKYDVSAEENNTRIQERMSQSLLFAAEDTAREYESVNVAQKNFLFNNSNVKYALYPVYILNTSWNNEKYTFAMNGQSGKFVGNLPVSKGRFALTLSALTVGYSALAAFIIWLFSTYFN